MKLKELINEFEFEVLSGEDSLDTDVTGGYASDILSDVMAKTKPGDIWVTNQGHQNVIAMVFFKRLAGVIIAGAVQPDDDALQKARQNKIAVLTTKMNAFEVIGRLYRSGVRG